MKLKNILFYPFENWLRALIFFVLSVALLLFDYYADSDLYTNTTAIILDVAFLNLFVSFIYQIFKKRWMGSFITGIIFFWLFIGSMLMPFHHYPIWVESFGKRFHCYDGFLAVYDGSEKSSDIQVDTSSQFSFDSAIILQETKVGAK